MKQRALHLVLLGLGLLPAPANAARLDLALVGPGGVLPPDMLRMDIIWTMTTVDTPAYDLDGFVARFNVWYYYPNAELRVTEVNSLPGWSTTSSMGIGDTFSESFFLGLNDNSGTGISGNGTEFTTIVASVFLQVQGNLAGTEVSFRHNDPMDPLPGAYDGPSEWQLRWQEEVTGPFQFDVGAGNPGDSSPSWPYQGEESYAPITFPPEPTSLVLLAVCALLLAGPRRSTPGNRRRGV